MAAVSPLRLQGLAEERAKLYSIIGERSYSEGADFRLSSGGATSFYFNLKPTLGSSQGVAIAARLFLEAALPLNPDYLAGLELGATPALGAIATLGFVEGRPVPTLYIRKKRKEHGTMLRIEGLAPGETLDGKKVVLIDDVATAGKSIYSAVEAIREEGGQVSSAIVLVDREEGATEYLQERGVRLIPIFRASEFARARD
jgi:orotate phosphoribosyltransferase